MKLRVEEIGSDKIVGEFSDVVLSLTDTSYWGDYRIELYNEGKKQYARIFDRDGNLTVDNVECNCCMPVLGEMTVYLVYASDYRVNCICGKEISSFHAPDGFMQILTYSGRCIELNKKNIRGIEKRKIVCSSYGGKKRYYMLDDYEIIVNGVSDPKFQNVDSKSPIKDYDYKLLLRGVYSV